MRNITSTLQSCQPRPTWFGKSKGCTASLILLENLGAADMVSDFLKLRIPLANVTLDS